MDLGEYIVMRVGLALLIVAVIVGFRLILALLLKGVNALLKLIGKEPGAKPQIQAKQPPKAPVVPKPPVVPHTPVTPQPPVTPQNPAAPKPPVVPPVQSYQPPVSAKPQTYSGTIPLDPSQTNGQFKTTPVSSGFSLRCVRGPMQGQRFPIGVDGCTIGRNPGSDIVFPAQTPGVSGNHCKVDIVYQCTYLPSGGRDFRLVDCNSTYGTYNGFGQRLPAGSGETLQVGSAFFLGSPNGPGFVFEFK